MKDEEAFRVYEWACGGVMKPLAIYYRKKGFSIIPLFAPKKEILYSIPAFHVVNQPSNTHLQRGIIRPLISNPRFYRDKLSSFENIEKWWDETPTANIGFYPGKVSNTLIITVPFGNNNYHFKNWQEEKITMALKFFQSIRYIFKYPIELFEKKFPQILNKVIQNIERKFDIKICGQSSCVWEFLPPMLTDEGRYIHKRKFDWIIPIWAYDKKPLPVWLKDEIREGIKKYKKE